MEVLLDAAAAAVSLAFLTILGIISGVALPGLFIAAAAPWLDWLLPTRKKP
jgi:ABC-type phosphate transport system auxiliary subunit